MHNYLQDKLEAEKVLTNHIHRLQLLYDGKSDKEKKTHRELSRVCKVERSNLFCSRFCDLRLVSQLYHKTIGLSSVF